jgi:hypothetical protein
VKASSRTDWGLCQAHFTMGSTMGTPMMLMMCAVITVG